MKKLIGSLEVNKELEDGVALQTFCVISLSAHTNEADGDLL